MPNDPKVTNVSTPPQVSDTMREMVEAYGEAEFAAGDPGFRSDRTTASKAMDALLREIAALEAAARDALSGWRYIRQVHGDLYGVGWDRVETALAAVLPEAPYA